MPAVTIIVEFETVEGAAAEFERIITDHARRTLHEERGCLRFEVVRPLDASGRPDPDRLVVDELYADEAAVAAHRANPRMAPLLAAMAPLIKAERRIEAHALSQSQIDEGKRPDELNAANDD